MVQSLGPVNSLIAISIPWNIKFQFLLPNNLIWLLVEIWTHLPWRCFQDPFARTFIVTARAIKVSWYILMGTMVTIAVFHLWSQNGDMHCDTILMLDLLSLTLPTPHRLRCTHKPFEASARPCRSTRIHLMQDMKSDWKSRNLTWNEISKRSINEIRIEVKNQIRYMNAVIKSENKWDQH